MLTIDPNRIDLAREFKQNPLGPHSPELQRVLKLMRWDAATERYITVQTEPGGKFRLARTNGPTNYPLKIYRPEYDTMAQAQWVIFRARWQQYTGQVLRLDDDEDNDPTAGPYEWSGDQVAKPILGYADRISVAQGERIEFKVSAELPGQYHARIVRLRSADRMHLGIRQTPVESPLEGDYPARHQPIYTGSYIDIPASQGFTLDNLTLLAYIWPTLPKGGRQALLGTWNVDQQCGYGLSIGIDGALCFDIGDGITRHSLSTGVSLLERHWYLVAVSVDRARGDIWLAQRPLMRYPRDDTSAEISIRIDVPAAMGERFRIAAATRQPDAPSRPRSDACDCYNGKLEAPLLARRALSAQERVLLMERAEFPDFVEQTVAHWDFSQAMTATRIVDISGGAHHGQTENLPTRAMKGYRWDGTEYNWSHKPEHYGAIHFHDDDLYDCGWLTDFYLDVSASLPSGLYCVQLSQAGHDDWIPFVVRPPRGKTTADLALILPTASYWAYANRQTVIGYPQREQVVGLFSSIDPTGLYLHHHPELGLSMYDCHRDGSGVCYSSRLRPILLMRPGEALWQLPADTHIIDWLDAKNISYDVLTEDDLDAEGAELLRPYRCVLTGTHPEYPSARVLEAIKQFQQGGGRFIYFGGNGFYWRVSYHPELPGVIEMRRAEDGIRAWMAEGGEYYHSFTGELGGMWRRMGHPPQSVAGSGMTAQGFDHSTYYRRTAQSHDERARFIFEGIGSDEIIGDFGSIGGGAAGWEIDRADTALGTPPHALVVARADTFSVSYHWMKEELHHTHSAITGETCPHVHCDMVFYETTNGGAVFSTSSIAWAGALAHNNYDNNVSRISENVIRRFLDARPFT